jgi:hypothetical protein
VGEVTTYFVVLQQYSLGKTEINHNERTTMAKVLIGGTGETRQLFFLVLV